MFRGIVLVTSVMLLYGGQSDRRRPTPRQRQQREVTEMKRRLQRFAAKPAAPLETQFLFARAGSLIGRAADQEPGSYVFERLEDSVDSLLDAAEELFAAAAWRNDGDDEPAREQQRTSRDLERTYFRVLQSEYFAQQSREAGSAEYVETSKRLYQAARSAYDRREYGRARRLASSARELVDAIESLAQAAVRVPEPPRLK
jgi:hypothetical protein